MGLKKFLVTVGLGALVGLVIARRPPQDPTVEELGETVRQAGGLNILHPGGLAVTEALARMCGIGPESKVLDVPCGSGATTRHIAGKYGAAVTGVELSGEIVERARSEAATLGTPNVTFRQGDALTLPLEDSSFDVVISECSLGLLDKSRALKEWVRVCKPGGRVGISDIYWTQDVDPGTKNSVEAAMGSYPETLAGWKALFQEAGLSNVRVEDRTVDLILMPMEMSSELSASAVGNAVAAAVRRFGLALPWLGLSWYRYDRAVRDGLLGYALIVGEKA